MLTTLLPSDAAPRAREADTAANALNERLEWVLAVHFDPHGGSPYWLERQRKLEIDVRKEIRNPADLAKLGPMDEQALALRNVEDFVPRSLLHRRHECLICETAGTLGRAKYAIHRRDEFEAAFVEPFVAAARRMGFPRGENWLFIGPSGPHIIGRAANACAQAMGSADCFAIDLDPRWAKKLPPGSVGWQRYVEHLEEQALAVLCIQRIGVIFSTPALLEGLAARLDADRRSAIKGLHLGGLAVSPQQRSSFARLYPNAVLLSGYGNSLFGMMPEVDGSPGGALSYFPRGQRLIVRVVPRVGEDAQRLAEDVEYGQTGQVVISRLDEMEFIANLMERDTAQRVRPPAWAAEDGFVLDGVREPRPIVTSRVKPALGLY